MWNQNTMTTFRSHRTGAANMVFTQGRGFVLGAPFGLKRRSLLCRVLVCHAADSLFGNVISVW